MGYIIITHTDMDGVAAAALYIYYTGVKPKEIVFAEPYNLEKKLKKIKVEGVDKIVLMDLGINQNNVDQVHDELARLSKEKIIIEWFDHHVWDTEWIEKMKNIGVNLYIDRSTCATGVIAKYHKPSREVDKKFVEELVSGVCAGDLWRFDHWRGPWYMRLIRRNDKPEWKMKVLSKLAKGILWDEEFTRNLIEKIDKEILSYNVTGKSIAVKTIDEIKIIVAPKHDGAETSFSAAYLMGRFDADVVCITSKDGKLSLRSRTVNVREIAKLLGGGGHPKASGAKIKIPLRIRILDLFIDGTIERYVLNIIGNTIKNISKEKLLLNR